MIGINQRTEVIGSEPPGVTQYRTTITVSVDDNDMHIAGVGTTEELSREAAVEAWAEAVMRLDALGDIQRKTGRINWAALASAT